MWNVLRSQSKVIRVQVTTDEEKLRENFIFNAILHIQQINFFSFEDEEIIFLLCDEKFLKPCVNPDEWRLEIIQHKSF